MQNRIKVFDGIRGISLIAICLYHLFPNKNILYIFVNIFLLLSGIFFVKNILSGRVNLFKTYKRLVLPLIYSFIIIIPIAYVLNQSLLKEINYQMLTGITFVNNYWQIFNKISYFDTFFSAPLLFTHIWYLSVLFMSMILSVFLINKNYPPGINIIIAGIISVLSMISMTYMMFMNIGIDRIYYDFISRCYPFFIGIIVGIFIVEIPKKRATFFQEIIIVLLILIICLILYFAKARVENMYLFEMQIFTILSAIVIYLLRDDGICSNIVSMFSVFASRSYEYYLVSFPITIIFKNNIIVIIILTLIIGEIIYQLMILDIEFIFPFIIILIFIVIFSIIDIKQPEMTELEKRVMETREKIDSRVFEKNIELSKKDDVISDKNNNSLIDDKEKINKNTSSIKKKKQTIRKNMVKQAFLIDENNIDSLLDKMKLTKYEKKMLSTKKVNFIGDSVFEASYNELLEYFPNMTLDAKIGLQVSGAVPLVDNIVSNGIGDIVVFSLGLNGPFNSNVYRGMIEKIGNRPIFLMNININSDYETQNNKTIKMLCDEYENVYLIDFKKFSNNHREIFDQDGVHPTIKGSKVMSNLISRYILEEVFSENK